MSRWMDGWMDGLFTIMDGMGKKEEMKEKKKILSRKFVIKWATPGLENI